MESFVANRACSSDVYSSLGFSKEETNHSLDEVSCYKMEKEQFQKSVSEERVAMKSMATSLLGSGKRAASLEVEKELLLKTKAGLVLTGRRQGGTGSRVGECFNENFLPMYLGFAFHVEKAIVMYCSREVSKLMPIVFEMRRRRRRRSEGVVELGLQREDGTLFDRDIPFQL